MRPRIITNETRMLTLRRIFGHIFVHMRLMGANSLFSTCTIRTLTTNAIANPASIGPMAPKKELKKEGTR